MQGRAHPYFHVWARYSRGMGVDSGRDLMLSIA